MPLYVTDPQRSVVQAIWWYPPREGDSPDYWSHTVHEELVIRDVASARRFFRKKLKWSPDAVRHIRRVRLIDQDPPLTFLGRPLVRGARAPR